MFMIKNDFLIIYNIALHFGSKDTVHPTWMSFYDERNRTVQTGDTKA